MSRERSKQWVLFRAAVAGATTIPAFCVGGAPTWATPLFLLLVSSAVLLAPSRKTTTAPLASLAPLAVAMVCLLQITPGSMALAPGLGSRIHEIVPHWRRVSVLPGETLLRLCQLVGLAALVSCARVAGWRLVARALAIAGTVVATLGYLQLASGAENLLWLYEPLEASMTGTRRGIPTTFVNPNHQVTLMLVTVSASVALLVDERRDTRKRRSAPPQLLLVAIALQAGVILLSESRGGWLAGTVLLCLLVSEWLLKSGRARRTVIVGAAFVSVAVVVVAWAIELEAIQEKIVSVELGAALFRGSPVIGIGRGCFGELSALVRSDHTNVRYVYIESGLAGLIFETGIVGLAAAVLVVVAVVRGHHRAPSRSQRIVWLGLIAVGIHSLVEFSLQMLGVSAAAAATIGSLDARGFRLPPVARRVLAGVVLVALALGTFSASRSRLSFDRSRRPDLEREWRPLSSRRALELARVACVALDESCATKAAIASKLAPFSAENWFMLSLAYKRADEAEAAVSSLGEGLAWLSRPVGDEFAVYLAQWWTPDELADAFPDSADVYRFVQAPLLRVAPEHLLAISAARSALHPEDPSPLANEARAALALERYDEAVRLGLATTELAPEQVDNWLLLAEIQRAGGGGEAEVRRVLVRALEHLSQPDDVERTRVALVSSLLEKPVDAARARELAQELVRAANTEEKRERFAALRDRAAAVLRRTENR